MTTALVLIDLQNDYFPGGNLPLSAIEAAAANAAGVLTHARQQGWQVIHVQHIANRPGATFFLPDTVGVEHHASCAPTAGETVVKKHFPNAFRDSTLQATLGAPATTALVIVGAMSHMCIDATTRAAFDLGYACTVVADACATRDLVFDGNTVPATQVHAAFMAALAAPYARVIPTATLLAG